MVARIKESWPGGSEQPADRVKAADVEGWLSGLGAARGASSLNSYVEVVRGVFALALRNGSVDTDPTGAVGYVKRSTPVRRTPTFAEFLAIVADVRGQPWNRWESGDSTDFLEFIGLAGLGQAEALSVTWADINWRAEQVTTFRHKTRRGFVIPLYPQLRPLLERLREDRGGNPPGERKGVPGAGRQEGHRRGV